MRRTSLLLIATIALAGACGPSVSNGDDDGPPADGGADPCTGTTTRCDGLIYQMCQNDVFVDVETCVGPQVCSPSFGCANCDPARPQTCVGDDAHLCNDDGTVGPYVSTCPFETCTDGFCQDEDGCSEQAKLIYVVDDAYNLLSFNPAMGMNTFTLIGQLDCPASASWPDWGNPVATPFSMSVDRTGTAWVLYTSGQIFHVSTVDASCSPTSFVAGTNNYQLFGMGFVSDSAGSTAEHLFVSGGPAADPGSGNLGSIDPATLGITTHGPLPQSENSPELSGTGNAELYAYYPGMTETFVARLDKTTAQIQQQWNLPLLTGQVYAWAFAHWGGRFYIFVTDGDIFGMNSKVYLLDPATGMTQLLLQNLPYYIVGAGVSTCAPVIIE